MFIRLASSLRLASSFLKISLLLILFIFSIFAVLRPESTAAQASSKAGTIPQTITYTWNIWGAEQYALTDDGDDLWIGASGSVVRWHKASQTYQRYSGVDGLPHRHVYVVAVDNVGNRWFGGDGGLSLLDKDEVWHHFTPVNSGLQSGLVDGIAVGDDNTLWLSHGLPDGRVSRRNPDGSWSWFPSRASAVGSDYSRILQTQNRNSLWAVADGEVWLDFLKYDGTQWFDSSPDWETAIPTQVMAAAGNVWALIQTSVHEVNLYKWENGIWSRPEFVPFVNFNSYATAFEVSKNGDIWVGYNMRAPYSIYNPAIVKVFSDPFRTDIEEAVPIQAMLANEEGLWAIGPAWLRAPDGVIHHLTDTLTLPKINDAVLDGGGKLWLNNYDIHNITYSVGKLQTFGDYGTTSTEDDEWTNHSSSHHIASAWERTPSGDLLSSWGLWSRMGWFGAPTLRWDRPGEHLQLPLPVYFGANSDIFAADDHHFWIADDSRTNVYDSPLTDLHRIVVGYDNHTPAKFEDDNWYRYAITSTGEDDVVAVDAVGRLWLGNSENLYLFQGEEGQPFFESTTAICDLTVDAVGTLYALQAQDEPCETTIGVLVIDPQNYVTYSSARNLAQDRYFTLRAVQHRNKLWTVAPDGAIWYVAKHYLSSKETYRIERYDGNRLLTYPLPFTPQAAIQLEVDAYNNVWLVHDNQLWRLSQPPGFVLNVQPLNWQVKSGTAAAGTVTLRSRDNYSGSVSISAIALSKDISVTVTPNPLPIGQAATVTLAVAGESQQRGYTVTLQASDALLTQTVILSITVPEGAFQNYLPLIAAQ